MQELGEEIFLLGSDEDKKILMPCWVGKRERMWESLWPGGCSEERALRYFYLAVMEACQAGGWLS